MLIQKANKIINFLLWEDSPAILFGLFVVTHTRQYLIFFQQIAWTTKIFLEVIPVFCMHISKIKEYLKKKIELLNY